jgi:abequosyltransferase
MTNPLLSICIATYNRADYIRETLDSIIPQVIDDVEIVIVDGASPDDTSDVVKSYMEVCKQIRYVRLLDKGGVDQDYDKAVELAHGEFCWLFTDDDLLRPRAVATVKTAISEGHGLLIVNAEVCDRTLAHVLERKRLVTQGDKMYSIDQMEDLFIDTMAYISFIGSVVIRRSIWLSRAREPYFGTEFIHVGVIFQNTLPESVLIISEPQICIRYGNAQWSPRQFNIWMFKWPKLVWSFDHISDDAKRRITRREPWRRLTNLILQRGRGAYTAEHYRKYFSALHSTKMWKISAWLISRLPVTILSKLLFYYGHLIKANSLLLYDLNPKDEV